jgi:hypothetical protein
MVERWNIGFQKDKSHFIFVINPVGGGTIYPILHYPRTYYSLRGVGATLRAGGHYSSIPSFQSHDLEALDRL